MSTSNILKTKVADYGITQLIQRLGRDCNPLQFVREYCQNSIEAIQRTNESGSIIVDTNWDWYESTQTYKLCFIDNGDGMTVEEMNEHLNSLSSSGHDENIFENYGVGAKIASLTRNHIGLMYDSWKGGEGHRILIHYDPDEKSYGIKPFNIDGETHWSIPLDNTSKPKIIEDHGTRVTLFGMDTDQDTLLNPGNAKGGRENWLYQYINTRYYTISDNVDLKVRVGYYRDPENKRHNYLRRVLGQKNTLETNKVDSGFLKLSDAIVHWWILDPERKGHGRELVNGHTACLNQNELFDISEGRSSLAAKFGIICGKEDVALYIEPSRVGYVQNTTRTGLIQTDGNSLPWERWQDEFNENMPRKLKDFVRGRMGDVSKDSHDESIRQRLKDVTKFFKISRYRASPDGSIEADPDTETLSLTGHFENREGSGGKGQKKSGNKPGVIEELLMSGLKEGGIKASEANPDKFPQVIWASKENGRRADDEMEDRAATYLSKLNTIKANADFQGYADVVKFFIDQYGEVDGAEPIIINRVQEVFEQQLVEAVMGSLSLRNRPKWNPDDFDKAISDEALTTAVMPKYYIINQIRRVLGTDLGSLKNLKTSDEAVA